MEGAAEGDPEYEAIAVIGYDPELGCYNEISLTNMGECGSKELRWLGDNKLVTVSSRMQFGHPEAARLLLELSETGAIQKVSINFT